LSAATAGQQPNFPFVAAVKGVALGGGFEIALGCHYRVCTPNAKFGLPEVKVGLLPGGGGTQRLPRIVGMQVALQYASTGNNMDASMAEMLKLVTAVVPEDQLLATAKKIIMDNPKAIAPWDKKGFKYPGGGGAMDPRSVMTMSGANAMASKETLNNYPAVRSILSCVFEGSVVSFDKAIAIESKYFTKLLLDPTAGNMVRTLFVNKLAADKGAARPKDEPKTELKKIGMLGAGLMGAGIAYESARAGLDVVLLDVNQEAADKGKAYSQRLVDRAKSKGRMTEEKAEALMGRLHPTTDFNALAGCDLIVEAVFESVEIKADVTKKAEAVVGPDVVFGSNTSTLPISDLQKTWSKPENFIGLHFFSPVEKMPLLEIIMGKDTGNKALAVGLDFARKIKKTPIVVNDGKGFYTSRCVGVYIAEGVAMVEEGIAPALIENCGRKAGFPMGPLLLNDSVNIDLGVKIADQWKKTLGDAYQPSPGESVQRKMVAEGRLGMKVGKGFYDYAEGAKKPSNLWSGLSGLYPLADVQPDAEEVQNRLMFAQVLECVKSFDEKVLTNPVDGDLGAIFGWGFPPFTGGPFSFLDTMGLANFVAACDALAEKIGPRFAPPQMLRDMAAAGKTFYGSR
ncbi:MAG: 3-hydroxyacyl-CoA dehydrogenase NAD-binding domain-containing protein, partial [Myxococcota bacterium]